MLRLLLAALTAAATTCILTPAAGRFARRVGAVDRPGDPRRIHDRPIPRMGGLAVFAGFALGTAAAGPPNRAILFGSALVTLLGALDDCFSLRPGTKLLGELLCAWAAVLGGTEIRALTAPAGTLLLPRFWGRSLTLLWIVGMTNALNLLDGLDGLASGVTAIGCAAALRVTLLSTGISAPAAALASLGGACLGFLPHNRHPARIFLGDAGSLLLGYTVACASVTGLCKAGTALAFALPLLIWALPLVDTAFAVVRRLLGGRNPFRADRRHLHHRLLDAGFSQREAARFLCLVSTALGLAAVLLASPGPEKPAAAGLALLSAAAAWRRARPFRRRKSAGGA